MTKYQCPDCQFIYDEELGYEHEGFQPGTKITELPEDQACPSCFVREFDEFTPIDE